MGLSWIMLDEEEQKKLLKSLRERIKQLRIPIEGEEEEDDDDYYQKGIRNMNNEQQQQQHPESEQAPFPESEQHGHEQS